MEPVVHYPHSVEHQPSDNGHSMTKFTLHGIFSAVIGIVFIISRLIVRLHGVTLTSGFLDSALIITGTILLVSRRYKSSPRLRWLFDTDWDRLIDTIKWGGSSLLRLTGAFAATMKMNTSATLSILCWTFSALFAFSRAIWLILNDRSDGIVEFFCIDGVFYALIFINMALVIVGGDEHQRSTYSHALVAGLAILAQLGFLASWALFISSPDEFQFPTWAAVLFLTALMEMVTIYLGDSTGHLDRLLDAKAVNLVWTSHGLVCICVGFGGITKRVLDNRNDPNYHRNLTIIIGFWAFAMLLFGFRTYCYSREHVSFIAGSWVRWLRTQQ